MVPTIHHFSQNNFPQYHFRKKYSFDQSFYYMKDLHNILRAHIENYLS